MPSTSRLIACPCEQNKGSKPVMIPLERCQYRLRFASLTNNHFENGCYLCPTGMAWYREEMMR